MAHPPRPLAASYFTDSDEDNSDVPEEVSVAESKRKIDQIDADLKHNQALQLRAKKEKNRVLDKKLKERSEKNQIHGSRVLVETEERDSDEESQESTSSRGEAVQPEDALEARMRRAMHDAQDEEVGGSDEDDGSFGVDDHPEDEDATENEGLGGASPLGKRNVLQEESDADSEDEDESEEGPSLVEKEVHSKTQVNYLPEDLFAAAFNSELKTKRKAESSVREGSRKKRRRKSRSGKTSESNRTIHILPNADAPTVPSTTPSKKVRKFLDRSLALKNPTKHLRAKGWERKPVKFGFMKQNGPALAFVRNP